MKLQKLIIENIASIEKACIDFEHGPLGEDSIFLICGPTGAGKSTLLDAVCLALYNTTPRLKQAANERYLDESDSFSGTGEVSIDDSRMLMRRDSVSAQVELWFTDAAGDALRAVWSVARARNKAGGKIQKVVWTLSLQDGTPLTNKSTETRMEIERRIGLTFEQFCRTTLLAQGEFTKFLKSKEEEKSNILEKLTGTEIYSRISREIYVMKTEKEAELQELKAQTGGIVLLTDEELAALQAEQRQVTEETVTLRTQLKQEQDLRKWLTDEQKLAHDLEETGKALQALTEPYVGRRTGTTERKVPFAECRPGATGAYAGAVPGPVGGVRDVSFQCAGKGAGVRIVAIAFGFVRPDSARTPAVGRLPERKSAQGRNPSKNAGSPPGSYGIV